MAARVTATVRSSSCFLTISQRCFRTGLSVATRRRSFVEPVAANKTGKSLYSTGFLHESHRRRVLRAEYTPVYVALGLIGLSTSLGLYTATHELEYAPNVLLRKKRRETVPEVEDPDWAAMEAKLFIDHSFFRRLAHLQKYPNPSFRTETVEDLGTVGVDPRGN